MDLRNLSALDLSIEASTFFNIAIPCSPGEKIISRKKNPPAFCLADYCGAIAIEYIAKTSMNPCFRVFLFKIYRQSLAAKNPNRRENRRAISCGSCNCFSVFQHFLASCRLICRQAGLNQCSNPEFTANPALTYDAKTLSAKGTKLAAVQDEVSYGPELSGIICGFSFSPGCEARPLDTIDAQVWLTAERNADSHEFIWLHFNRNAHSEKWLREHFTLPEHYFETMREGQGSTRIEQAEDCLIAVINDVIFDFSYDASEIATLWMCVNRNFVISSRVNPLRSVDRLRLSVKNGENFTSPISLLAHLLRDEADVLEQIQREASLRVDQIEDDLLIGRLNTKRSTLGSLRRVFVRLRRLLVPEPGALFRLLNRPPSWFESDDARELRAATEEFSAVLNDLADLQERTKLLQEEIVSHATEQTNRSVYLLTMVTVLALPINIIAGLLGMNVGGIPLAQDPEGFWVIAAIVATFTGIAGWFAFFKQRD